MGGEFAEGEFRRPGRLEAFFNRTLGVLLGLGIGPGHMHLLEVRGRSSGRLIATPVDPLEYGGQIFLVAPRGTTQWVENLRASGIAALRRGGVRREYAAREVPIADRPRLLKAYLEAYRVEVQRYFDIAAGADEQAFVRVAAAYPVFALEARGTAAVPA